MMHLSSTDSVDEVGKMEYSFDIYSLRLLTPVTVNTLILPYLFCLRNIQDYNTLFLWVSSSYLQ